MMLSKLHYRCWDTDMQFNLKNILKALSIPLTLAAVYATYVILWRLLDLPTPEELTKLIGQYFDQYGLWIVLVSAFIEGMLLLGQYFPGGFVIFLGVIAARGDVWRATEVVAIVSLSFFAAYYVNYLLGKYGWYRIFAKFGLQGSIERAQEKLNKHVLFAVLANYWDTNIASVVATAAGVLKLPLGKFLFYSAISIAVWNTFWGFVVYFIGEALIDNELSISLWILLVWAIVIIVKVFFWQKIKCRFVRSKL